MRTTKSIIAVLFVLLTAQIASAYYCPSTGRWLSRDPIGEPGFENLRAAGAVSPTVSSDQSQSTRWINRDSEKSLSKNERVDALLKLIKTVSPETADLFRSKLARKNAKTGSETSQDTFNRYIFVENDSVINIDGFGLKFTSSCSSASPLKASDCTCDAYGSETYPLLGVNLKCFCKCAGDSPWSQAVRGCLACSHSNGDDVTEAHLRCYYEASKKYSAPKTTIAACYISCGGYVPPPPYPPVFPILPPGLGGF